MPIDKKRPIILLLIAVFAASTFAGPRRASGKNLCAASRIPAGARGLLRRRASGWTLQDVGRLSASARERWAAKRPSSCPGLAIGRFESTMTVSYGLLLVPRKTSAKGYRLLILTRLDGHYRLREAEASKSADPANFFVHDVPVSRFFDLNAQRKFNIRFPDGIVLVDSGRNENESDIFFLSGGAYHSQPVDY